MITKSIPIALLTAFTLVGIVIAPSAADARGGGALTFRLGLNVPTICRIDVRGPVGAATGAGSAVAEEFCNAPAGYRVLAIHPGADGSGLSFEYDGRRVPASAGGTTVLVEEQTAAHHVRPFAVIHPRQGQASLANVTLQIVPR
jgi:hypothetical protein